VATARRLEIELGGERSSEGVNVAGIEDAAHRDCSEIWRALH
jgi:hypothetical protein